MIATTIGALQGRTGSQLTLSAARSREARDETQAVASATGLRPDQMSATAPPRPLKNVSVSRELDKLAFQLMVQAMLPEKSRVFGTGTAGGIWRSMLADGLGSVIAQSQSISLLKMTAHPNRYAPDVREIGGLHRDGTP